MNDRRKGQEMIKRGAEELQILVEEKLSRTLCSMEVLSEGRGSYGKAMEVFSKALRREFDDLVKKLQNYKVEKEDGLIEFRLEGPVLALRSVVDLVEDWILPFWGGLETEQKWLKNLKLLETLHASVVDRVGDLSRNEAIGSCLSYSERFFIRGRVEAFRMLKEGVKRAKVNRLSLKKKCKID